MTSFHAVIPEEKLTEAYRLLLEMRGNCVKHADDQYDDPKREAKYEALNIAMNAMGRSIPSRWISVEERLPEGNDDVLVFVQHPISGHCWTQIAHRLSAMALDECDEYDEWWLDGSVEPVRYITHWMPLPEPPEVEHETVHDCNS